MFHLFISFIYAGRAQQHEISGKINFTLFGCSGMRVAVTKVHIKFFWGNSESGILQYFRKKQIS